jgi:mRNA interferase HigB
MGTIVRYSCPMQRWLAVMRIVGREKLHSFCETHGAARKWIANWLSEVEAAVWTDPRAIKARYPAASFLGQNVVIFNVKGNSHRLEVVVAYRSSVVQIVWAGTHAEYDRRHAKH